MVYRRRIGHETYTFGVSGRLYKSNVLLYDHQTESLWSQLMKKAIAGPLAGTELEVIPSTVISWRVWKRRWPQTLVLSTETGYQRNYGVDPYQGYYRALGIWFPVGKVRKDLGAKEMVLGIEIGGEAKAFPLSELKKHPGTIEDEVGGKGIRITVGRDGEVTGVHDRKGNPIPSTFGYWFAWQAFHPETRVFRRDE